MKLIRRYGEIGRSTPARAPTRREAAAKLARALEAMRIQGITHNRDVLVAILRTPEFLRGETTTDFIAQVKPRPARVVDQAELNAFIGAVNSRIGKRRGGSKAA